MKKTILILAALLFFGGAYAQTAAIPTDPNVKIGKLDNGLTYYIRHNEEPKGQANFYIAQKVGSILEEENQRGLAHFLEHMCFNGTEHFPGNRVIEYCEGIGVKWGADLNAYTDVDETVYNIDNVPIQKYPSAVDSCLLILHDWATGLLLKDEDIDHERGVIHEEWRMRSNAQMRMFEQILPELYPGNLYGQRLPIGKMEVVDNFPYKDLRDYYQKWYRPDQQGIIVVGDIDVDQVEGKIKTLFSPIKMPQNAAERKYVQIEDNDSPIVVMAKDKEQSFAMTIIMNKHEAFPAQMRESMNYYAYKYALNAISNMLNARMQELLQKPEPPFIQCFTSDGNFLIAKTKKAFQSFVISSEKEITNAVKAAYREILRAKKHGFTASEYVRAKADILSYLESNLKAIDKKKSGDYCHEYVRHFIDREPIAGASNDLALTKQLSEAMSVEMLNQLFQQLISSNNLAICSMLPLKEDIVYPTAQQITAAIKEVESETIEPYCDQVSDEPLLKEEPTPGKVLSKKPWKMGYTEYLLSNGARLYFKQTDFNKDEVLVRAISRGGTSLYDKSEVANLKALGEIIQIGGVGNFSQTELQKVLAGKKVYSYLNVGYTTEGLESSSTPKDLETLFQLNYLKFTALRKDPDAFSSWKTRSISMVLNRASDPMSALQDTIKTAIYKNAERFLDIKKEQIEKVDYDRTLQIARERFQNAADFAFFVTGAVDEATLLGLVEKYIASLPGSKEKEKANLSVMQMRDGKQTHHFEREMQTPMVTTCFFNQADVNLSLREMLSHELALNALTVVLNEQIREKEGGTYSIGAYGDPLPSLAMIGKKDMIILYQTDPKKYEYLNGRIAEILEKFLSEGPSPENLKKGKEYFLKQFKEHSEENWFWSSSAADLLLYGKDLMQDYEKVLSQISSEDVRKSLKGLIDKKNHAEIIMIGTAMKK